MTNCIPSTYQFSKVKNWKLDVNFTGGDISDDGGVLLLREADKILGITTNLAKIFPDKQGANKVIHCMVTMLRQLTYGIALGYC